MLALDLAGHAPRVAEEAAALLDAPRCPEGATTLVLAGEQLALQIHESVGHAVELDRVLGYEASYAGTSWAPADGAGSLRYGSEAMAITADATLPGALGSYHWDDEGVPAQSIAIVRDGVLDGFLLLRDPVYSGVTPEFWGSLDAVCSADEWRLVSFTDCGKGEPGQVARVSHGCAPARFRGVRVGAA